MHLLEACEKDVSVENIQKVAVTMDILCSDQELGYLLEILGAMEGGKNAATISKSL
jgi:hypothetical protein